jgi:hypothetical protein
MKMQFGNLIQDSDTGGPLLGYVNGFTMDPLLDEGMHTWERGSGAKPTPMKMKGAAGETGGILPRGTGSPHVQYIPKTVRLNCEFAVLHQHPLGWHGKSLRGGTQQGFPYGRDKFTYEKHKNLKATDWHMGREAIVKALKTTKPGTPEYAQLVKALKK